jgi:chromosome partitioning protein
VVNIAAVWGELGRKVLVVDFDPQGNASLHFGVRDTGGRFLQAMEKTIALPVLSTTTAGVDLVACGPALSRAAERFSGVLGADLFNRCLARTHGDWEVFLIDCPPSSGILTMSALRVSRYLIIPVEATQLAVHGLHQMMETLHSIRRENHGPELLGIIACRANARRRVHRDRRV